MKFPPKNKIWGIQLKRQWIGTSQNPCKASKIHSFSDIRPELGKGKVCKTDERIEIRRIVMRIRTLVNGVKMSFAGVFIM